jgi:hypothetical protein
VLARALRKQGEHERIIAIDLNDPSTPDTQDAATKWLNRRTWPVRRHFVCCASAENLATA